MVCLSIRGEVEVLPVTWTEQNAVVLRYFNPLFVQFEPERSSVDYNKLVVTLDAWTEDTARGI